MTGKQVRICAVSGSPRKGSGVRKAIEVACRAAREAGAEVVVLDLAEEPLPLMDERDPSRYPPEVARFRAALRAADGIILSSPEYHGTLSGTLKNALDHCGFEEFEGKVAGLVAVAGGSQGAGLTLLTMATAARTLHAWVLPAQVSIPASRDAFLPTGEPADPRIAARLADLGRALVEAAARLRS